MKPKLKLVKEQLALKMKHEFNTFVGHMFLSVFMPLENSKFESVIDSPQSFDHFLCSNQFSPLVFCQTTQTQLLPCKHGCDKILIG